MSSWSFGRVLSTVTVVVLVIVAVILPQTISDFRIDQVSGWIPLAVAALGLNLLTGYNGQISVGHGALYGAGAYACGLLVAKWHWGLGGAVLGAAVVCFAIGVVIGLPALRIKGLYLALVTLAVAVLFPDLLKQFQSFTGGSKGLFLTSAQVNSRGVAVDRPIALLPPSWINQTKSQWTYYVFLVVAAVCFVFVRNLIHSRTGRAIIAIRDNEVAAEVNGVEVARTKVLVFGLSSALAGVGGGLYALWHTQLYPQSFTLSQSLFLLVAVVVGGSASVIGPAIGALFVGVFQDIITPELPQRATTATPLILGIILILMMLIAPGGVVGLARQALSRVTSSKAAPSVEPVPQGAP